MFLNFYLSLNVLITESYYVFSHTINRVFPMVNNPRFVLTKKRHIFSLTLIISLLLIAGAFFYYSFDKQRIYEDKQNELKEIAQLKISQLSKWNTERISDSKFVSGNPLIVKDLEAYYNDKNNNPLHQEIVQTFSLMKEENMYESIFITNQYGQPLFTTERGFDKIDSTTLCFIKKGSVEKKCIRTDLYINSINKEIYLDYIAPVLNRADKVIAVVVLRVNPKEYLFPLIQEWPSQSKTSETLIVRKEDDNVLFLNDLRSKQNSALNFRIPLTEKEFPSVMAVSGYKGVFEGKNYNGVNVLADIEPVEGTNWFMIAEVSENEIYSGLYARELFIILITFIMIILTVTGLGWVYHFRQKNIYKELFVKEKELKEYHEEFRTVLYSIGDGVITTDDSGRIRQMNHTAEELTGWSETISCGKPLEQVFKIINEETREIVENPVHKVLKSGGIVGLANHTLLINKEGDEIPIADSGAPIKDENEKTDGVVLVFRDKTEEHRAEKMIRQSEARLKRAELVSKTGNWELNLDNGTMTYSDGACRVYGINTYIVNLSDIHKYLLEEYRSVFDCAMWDLIEEGKSFDIEYKIRNAVTGQIHDIHSIAEYDKDKNILFGVFTDITELKQAEKEVKLLAQAIESINECVSITDEKNNIIFVNNAFVETYGFSKEELIGKDAASLQPADVQMENYNEVVNETITGGWKGEIINRKKDGTKFPVFLSTSSIQNEMGDPVALIGVASDITEEKRNRDELIRAKEKAEEMNKLKTNFLSNMSHELRTPMIGILGFSELLKTELENSELKKMADSIYLGGRRLLNTLNLVLDLARIESNKEVIKMEQVNLHQQLTEILRTFNGAAQSKNLLFNYETCDKNIHAFLDKRIFEQVMNNLVNNAIKFTLEGGVSVKTEIENNDEGNCCLIKVIDTGIGISEADLNIIFEEFRQASEGLGRSFEGTGLGLTITKKSVELMNGTISVNSLFGKGTTFCVRFPAFKPDIEFR